MNLEQERQRFEAWFNDARIIGRFTEEGLWQTWQAAINSRTESRQTEMKDYPGHAQIKAYIHNRNAVSAKDKMLLSEFSNLLRQYQKLREAVCVLEPDTIGQVGDLYYDKFAMVAFKLDQALIDKWDVRPEGHIAERNGKPCVYRSELEGI